MRPRIYRRNGKLRLFIPLSNGKRIDIPIHSRTALKGSEMEVLRVIAEIVTPLEGRIMRIEERITRLEEMLKKLAQR